MILCSVCEYSAHHWTWSRPCISSCFSPCSTTGDISSVVLSWRWSAQWPVNLLHNMLTIRPSLSQSYRYRQHLSFNLVKVWIMIFPVCWTSFRSCGNGGQTWVSVIRFWCNFSFLYYQETAFSASPLYMPGGSTTLSKVLRSLVASTCICVTGAHSRSGWNLRADQLRDLVHGFAIFIQFLKTILFGLC